MKKLMLMLCLCVGVCLPGFSQYINENVYRGNMSLNQVLKVINGAGFLPLYIHDTGSFIDGGKGTAKKAVEERMKQERYTYRTFYNAAVVYATKPEFQGYDNYYPLRADIANKAIEYATKAITINATEAKKKGIAESPYMYLLRGEVRYEQALFQNVANGTVSINPGKTEMAKGALSDLQKVAKLQPNIATYSHMSDLAKVLGKKELVDKYTQLQKEYDRVNARKLAEAKAAQREVKAKVGRPSQSVDMTKAGVSSHWRF